MIASQIQWYEKYRPSTLAECVLPKHIKAKGEEFLRNKAIPNLLLHSLSPGTGKTTFVKALCKQLNYDVLEINGSNEGRKIDTLRDEITPFVSNMSSTGNRRVVFMDEACHMFGDIQAALRAFIEKHTSSTFIFACNYPEKIIEHIHSRCVYHLDFTMPNDEAKQLKIQMCIAVCEILKAENVSYQKETVWKIVSKYFPDNRRIINEIQSNVFDHQLTLEHILEPNLDLSFIFKNLKKKNYVTLSNWVNTTPYINFENVISQMEMHLKTYITNSTMLEFIFCIEKYQDNMSRSPNKYITLKAMFAALMTNKEINYI